MFCFPREVGKEAEAKPRVAPSGGHDQRNLGRNRAAEPPDRREEAILNSRTHGGGGVLGGLRGPTSPSTVHPFIGISSVVLGWIKRAPASSAWRGRALSGDEDLAAQHKTASAGRHFGG